MATKLLAKQLGLIRRSSVTLLSSKNLAKPKSKQFFDYLIIIDFESTCWKDTKHYGQEIIEFPAVLLNTANGEVESEFHTYVQPQEHPILSEFCTELTGIKQDQVEEGIPLKICLSQFCNWIQRIQTEKKIVFLSAALINPSLDDKLCTFVTWSDWDLEVCLLYECKRKQLRKPDILNSWIDLRATYKEFYNRKPKGLNGALQDLGITFSGREHSGLDDSRNTARLAWRMICDGCVMKITKSLDKVRPKMNYAARTGNSSLAQSTTIPNVITAEASKVGTVAGKSQLDLRKDNVSKTLETCQEKEESSTVSASNSYSLHPLDLDEHTEDHSTTHSLLSPQTLINGLPAPFRHRPHHTSYCSTSMNMTNGVQIGHFSSTSDGNTSIAGSGLVLVSTTISSISNISESDVTSTSECLSMLVDWEDLAVIPDSQNEQTSETPHLEDTADLSGDSSESVVLKSPSEISFYKLFDNRKKTKVQQTPFIKSSIVYKSPNTTIYNVGEVNKHACSSFKVPEALVNLSNRLTDAKQSCSSLKHSEPIESNSRTLNDNRLPHFKRPQPDVKITSKLADGSNVVQQSKCSTLLPYFPKRKHSSTQFISPPKKQSFTVHKDKEMANVSMPPARAHPRTVPANVLNSSVNKNQPFRAMNNGKVTPPLCKCGRRSKRLTVSSIGPNQGRAFYSCPVGKRVEGKKKGCGYFKWEHPFLKEPAAQSSFFSSTAASCPTLVTSSISSRSSSPSPKRILGLRPSMRM
ncbi:ERI1 exoribonuclease 2 isoform X2 [Ambystoma mexicanum]